MLHGNDFPDTGRFQILKRLGSGGMGVVYEALDRVRGEAVALKTLRWPDGATIYRFKKEFRTLADIAHTNLVALYELFGERDQWYFTMELVPGVEFTEHVRPHGLDVTRLRPALAQVAEGLVAVHRAGKLHRDLKPSNVKVTPQGRVVILDFGISADALAVRNSGPPRTIEDGVWGTVAYMAPEQIDGHPAVASDWYALGCTL
jgi:serine/threonine protein kinase